MGLFNKTAYGEQLTYPARDLDDYSGEQFCLRITVDEMDLDRCFFVYIDERFEEYTLRKLFQTYFIAPGPDQDSEMASWLEPWKQLDPMLAQKDVLLRQMFASVREYSGTITYHINQGPSPVDLEDRVRDHLGTSVFEDGTFNDKILDIVLQFRVDGQRLPEQAEWEKFAPVDTTLVTEELATGGGTKRRSFFGWFALLVGIISLPTLGAGCSSKDDDDKRGGGFIGGAL